MAMWNRCAICGKSIPVGELCYGVKNWRGDPIGGDTICRDCLVPENAPTLTPLNEPKGDGLYGKYTVYKNKDGSLVTDCFILRPAKDPAAVAALRAYAATTDNAELASDIINWVGAEPNEPLTQADLDSMDYDKAWIDYGDEVGGETMDSPTGTYTVYRRPPEGEEDT